MKTLNLHCDYIKFKGLKKALKNIDDLAPNQVLDGDSTECLVVLVAVEKGDSVASVEPLVSSINDIVSQVNVKNVVLYPYAHLSSNLGSPSTAVKVLDTAAKKLSAYNVVRAPFGYYKSFELKVKGHPLSELSREFVGDSKEISGSDDESVSDEEVKRLLRQISKARLDTSKLKDNDHRIIGQKLDLWSFSNVAPGMVFWHDKGLHIKNKLIEFWREKHRGDYQEISTPQIMDSKLWKVSGHWDKYKENNFVTEYEGRPFLAKPMNCPGGMLVYNASPKSYKDLPLRIGEMGVVHRVELSGVLAGLFRVIQFTQDDAHLFCASADQTKDEIFRLMDLIKLFYDTFGLEFDHVELSTRPKKRIGSDSDWDTAEGLLEAALKEKGIKYVVNKGDGAFYGPKIDFHVKDSLNRTWQCSTIQADFALPERFDLTYTSEDGSSKRPIILHRVIYGSLERFIAIITEHLNGKFPLWLSPNQVKVLSMNDSTNAYAEKVHEQISIAGYRCELDTRSESMPKKAREAAIQGFNYVVTVGEREQSDTVVAVKKRGEKTIKTMSLDDFIALLATEVSSKAL